MIRMKVIGSIGMLQLYKPPLDKLFVDRQWKSDRSLSTEGEKKHDLT